MKNDEYGRLAVREAAGCFWLVDTAQSGRPYRPPLKMNESGARICRALSLGKTPEEIAEKLSEEGGAAYTEVLEDVRAFIAVIEKELAQRNNL